MEEYLFGDSQSDTVLIQMVDDNDLSAMEQEIRYIRDLSGQSFFRVIAVKADDWNRDLTPWAVSGVLKNVQFGDGASSTLRWLKERIQHLESCPDKSESPEQEMPPQGRRYYLGGYSIGGLFALWAGYQTGLFSGIAAASPSVWYPGFRKYAGSHLMQCGSVYLSLGSREEKARNPVLSSVGDSIREIYQDLLEDGIRCVLEWNEGNHFHETDRRMAKGFAWLLANDRKDG